MGLKENIEKVNYALKVIDDIKDEYFRVREAREKNPDDEAIVKRSEEIQDMLEPIITDTLEDLRKVSSFFMSFQKEMKDKYTRIILSDNEDGSDVSDEDVAKFQAVIENDEAYNHFINIELPKNLEELGMTKEEYAQLMANCEDLYADDYETVMDKVYRKAILEPDLESDESRHDFLEKVLQEMITEDFEKLNPAQDSPKETLCNTSFSEQLQTSDTGPNSDPS